MPDFSSQFEREKDPQMQFIKSQMNRLELELQRIHWERQNALGDPGLVMEEFFWRNQHRFEDIQTLISSIQQALSSY